MRVYLAVAVIIALLGASGSYWVHSLYTENKTLSEANTALNHELSALREAHEREQKAAQAHVKKTTAVRQEQEKADAALDAAAVANPDWAVQRVPGDVLRALGMQPPAN